MTMESVTETDRDSKISIDQDDESFNIRTYQSKDKNKNSEVLCMVNSNVRL